MYSPTYFQRLQANKYLNWTCASLLCTWPIFFKETQLVTPKHNLPKLKQMIPWASKSDQYNKNRLNTMHVTFHSRNQWSSHLSSWLHNESQLYFALIINRDTENYSPTLPWARNLWYSYREFLSTMNDSPGF